MKYKNESRRMKGSEGCRRTGMWDRIKNAVQMNAVGAVLLYAERARGVFFRESCHRGKGESSSNRAVRTARDFSQYTSAQSACDRRSCRLEGVLLSCPPAI